MQWGEKFDLLEYFPVQPVYAVQKTFWPLVVTVLAWVAAANRITVPIPIIGPQAALGLAIILTVVCAVSLIYWEAYRRRMAYFVEDYRIFSARGVICRTVNSGQLTGFWDFKVDQKFLDWLFDVWYLQLYADFARGDFIHHVPALSKEDAYTAIHILNRETDRQLGVAGGALEKQRELERQALEAAEAEISDGL